jgi:hypothetical protein
MSKHIMNTQDIRVIQLSTTVDSYITSKYGHVSVSDWTIGPSFVCDTKWQKTVDEFVTFKIYEPRECNECIPVAQRNTVSIKFTIHHGNLLIQDSEEYSKTLDISELLSSFDNVMNNKFKIIDTYKKYIRNINMSLQQGG